MTGPRYNESRGGACTAGEPPFRFEGAIMRSFPLAASVDRLQAFVDEYLNLAPRSVAYYRPLAGWVQFVMLNYGRMASSVRSAGWISQHEFGFAIPLERYREVDGALTFDGLSSVMPYVFVDDPSSQTTGREVYGWPKLEGKLVRKVPSWTRHPRARREVMTLETSLFAEAFAGQEEAARVVVEITEAPTLSVAQYPPRLDTALNPFFSIPRAMVNAWELGMDVWETIARPAYAGYPPNWSERQNALDVLFKAFDPEERPKWSCANLKQFRDAEQPQRAAYQALVEADMTLVALNGSGLLGDDRVALGDTTGGYRLRVHDYDSLRMVATLGIEVDQDEQGSNANVAVLSPTLPSWVDMNLDYGAGRVLAWRSHDGGWMVPEQGGGPGGGPDGTPTYVAVGATGDGAGQAAAAAAAMATGSGAGGLPDYNTALGTALVTYPGPFEFPGAVIHVLPLLADQRKLDRFCNAYLNEDVRDGSPSRSLERHRFEACGPYVYLILQYYPMMRADVQDIGQWVRRSARFSFPVKWYEGAGKMETLRSAGLLSPFVFYEGQSGTQTAREVPGLPADQAGIVEGAAGWLEASDRTTLVRVSAQCIDALGMGRKATWMPLFDVVKGDIGREVDPLALEPDLRDWWHRVEAERERKERVAADHSVEFAGLKSMAFELLVNERAFNEISLKQFRDAARPGQACYQAIVRSRTKIKRLHDLQETEGKLHHVVIHRRESHPIVNLLGLEVKHVLGGAGARRDALEVQRPFWLRADLRTALGENLCWRVHDEKWNEDFWPRDHYFDGADAIRVGRGLLDLLPEGPRPDLGRAYEEWRRLSEDAPSRQPKLRLAEAVEAMSVVDPQVAIDSILSQEWGHAGDSRAVRSRRGEAVERKPDHCVRRDSAGHLADVLAPVEPDARSYSSSDHDRAGWVCGPGASPPPPAAPGAGGKA